jgi:surface polysaccharide O-acyltransferase-like enzyme
MHQRKTVMMQQKNTEDSSIPIDLIRTVAIIMVIMIHAAIEPHPMVQVMDQTEVARWFTVTTYNAFADPCVPLFVMLSGALLLQPSKVEPIRVFLKKRATRLGLPFVFWGTTYFLWREFVNHEALTVSSVVQSILTGPYYHFWFLYMLTGLYIITPVLRILTAHAERRILRYLLLVVFVGTAVIPLLVLVSGFTIELKLFAVTGWIGYFVLGYYLLTARVRSSVLYALYLTGFLTTIIGTYTATSLAGGHTGLFFLDYLSSASVVLASVALFMLLLKVSPTAIAKRSPWGSKLLHFIGCSTLAVYLLHVMVLESLQKGFFGFQISVNTMNPIVEVPLITAVTFVISLGIVFVLKRVPIVKRIIG